MRLERERILDNRVLGHNVAQVVAEIRSGRPAVRKVARGRETPIGGSVNTPWRWAVAALLGAASILFVAFPAPVAKYSGYEALTEHAMELVDESFARDEKTFLVITGIKTALAVVEGSEVGVGFELKIGDVVQAPYDIVNFFWDMFLYAFLILGSYRLLLETGMLALGLAVMGIGFALCAVAVATNARGKLWRWSRRTLLGGAVFAYAVPFEIGRAHV